MTKNQLIVQVDTDQMAKLKSQGFNLCIAKSLEDSASGSTDADPNVIWSGVR
jgi:hypothetical protein